jgi:citrate lyase subunit beta/citryl-CoA lyase
MSPRAALFDEGDAAPDIPVCDHYAGVEPRMTKSLQLQAQIGPVFDVTLDNEDGAPIGGEVDHAHLIVSLLGGPDNRWGRVGVRLLPVAHPKFEDVARVVLAGAKSARAPAYLMLPKPERLADVEAAAKAIDTLGGSAVPLHALVETHGALRQVFDIAAHPRIESLSFGLMDFVSAHRGAIPQTAMGGAQGVGQFDHPLVLRAKLEIAAACHAAGKVPSHCVFTEFKDTQALSAAAETACKRLGYTRMWSIHPSQIKPIVEAFSPTVAELDQAVAIIRAAEDAQWAPIQHKNTLHDRASYRYFWQLIARAHRTSMVGAPQLPAEIRARWFPAA